MVHDCLFIYITAGHHIWRSFPYPPPGDAAGSLQQGPNHLIVEHYSLALGCNILSFISVEALDGHAGSAVKVSVAIQYSVVVARNGYIRNVVV